MNHLSYFEIQVDEPERAMAFYSHVFGWKFVEQQGIDSRYWRIEGAGLYGGLLPRPPGLPRGPHATNAFVCSIEVADFDVTAREILAKGGVEAFPKFAIPGRCWQGYFLDPEKNTFGIFQVDAQAK